MKHVWVLLAAAAAVLAPGCGGKSQANLNPVFPPDGEAPGWIMERQPRVFQAENLWEYIDGDAEKYVQAGFDSVRNAAYRHQGKVEASVDVYAMKTPAAATAIFDAESSQGSQPVSVGDGGKLYGASIVFRKGPYLVRIIAYQDGPEVQKALTDLALPLAKRLAAQN